jgi:hypothetical protein
MNPASWAAAYTTWRDTEVIAWLEKYPVAIQVDAKPVDAHLRDAAEDAIDQPSLDPKPQ